MLEERLEEEDGMVGEELLLLLDGDGSVEMSSVGGASCWTSEVSRGEEGTVAVCLDCVENEAGAGE